MFFLIFGDSEKKLDWNSSRGYTHTIKQVTDVLLVCWCGRWGFLVFLSASRSKAQETLGNESPSHKLLNMPEDEVKITCTLRNTFMCGRSLCPGNLKKLKTRVRTRFHDPPLALACFTGRGVESSCDSIRGRSCQRAFRGYTRPNKKRKTTKHN